MSEPMKPSVMKMAGRALAAAMLAGGILLAAAPYAWAQQTASEAGPAPTKAVQQKAMDRADRVDARILSLHDKLHITPAQGPAWNDFAQVMRDNAKEMKALLDQRAQQLKTMTAVTELQSHAQMADVHAAEMRKLVTAFETLYNTMPEDQKKIADKVITYRVERREHRGK